MLRGVLSRALNPMGGAELWGAPAAPQGLLLTAGKGFGNGRGARKEREESRAEGGAGNMEITRELHKVPG